MAASLSFGFGGFVLRNGLTRDGWRSHRLIESLSESGCIVWVGCVDRDGYALAHLSRAAGEAGKRLVRLHRWVWSVERGPIPAGMHLDHICRVRCCVNPDHLRVVTPRVNALENSLATVAANVRKTACSRCGGPYTQRPYGRICVSCKREDNRRLSRKYKADPSKAELLAARAERSRERDYRDPVSKRSVVAINPEAK